MSDPLLLSELVHTQEHPLEGAIVVHGFLGNIEKPENVTLAQVIIAGTLASPSKRQLDFREQERLVSAPFDRDRICFHPWKEGGEQPTSYIGHAIWAGPTTAMEGTIIGDDPANEAGDIFAFRAGGVDIPVRKGVLFVSDNLIDTPEIRMSIKQRATQDGVTFDEWMKDNVVLLPTKLFHQTKELFSVIAQRIRPAAGVTADFVDAEEIGQSSGVNFVTSLNAKHKPVSTRELGTAVKIQGESVSEEMMQEWERNYRHFDEAFGEIIAEMDENPLRLEELRDSEFMYDGAWEFHLLHRRLQTFSPDSELARKIHTLNERRKDAFERNEQILVERFPNMPEHEDAPIDSSQKPYREKNTGRIRISIPL